jgi:hypothetical protein
MPLVLPTSVTARSLPIPSLQNAIQLNVHRLVFPRVCLAAPQESFVFRPRDYCKPQSGFCRMRLDQNRDYS